MDIVWAGPSDLTLNRDMSNWAARVIWPNQEESFGPSTCMAVLRDGQLLSVIVWHNWNRCAGVMEFSGASVSKRWLTKPVLNAMFSYPFDEVGCQLVVARISETNHPLKRQLKSIGFDQLTIPRLRGRDEAEIICTMTHEQWQASKFKERTNG